MLQMGFFFASARAPPPPSQSVFLVHSGNFEFASPALPSFSVREPPGSSPASTEEILCFSCAPSDTKTQRGRAKKGGGWGGSPHLMERPPHPLDPTRQVCCDILGK